MADPAIRRARRLSLELKYATIAVAVVALFVLLHAAGAFTGVQIRYPRDRPWV